MNNTNAAPQADLAAAQSLHEGILMQPLWLQGWIGWMVAVNILGALIFIRRPEAKWVLVAMAGNMALMNWLFAVYGYQRILGLAHVVFWTPLVIYLWRRRPHWKVETPRGKWIVLLFVTNVASLIVDYIDVARYLAGERL